MPPTTTPFRALKAASKVQTYTPRTFRAPSQPFQPRKPLLSASSFRTFSSSFQRFSTELPPTPDQTPAQNASSQEVSGPVVHSPVFDSAPTPAMKGRKPLYESATNQPPTLPRGNVPSYEMTVTCKPCSTRSTHRISKQGYHHGSVLITCPECRNRHIVSDHLKVFGDKVQTMEDFMRANGEFVKKGTLSENGDTEFWEDGTSTERAKPDEPKH